MWYGNYKTDIYMNTCATKYAYEWRYSLNGHTWAMLLFLSGPRDARKHNCIKDLWDEWKDLVYLLMASEQPWSTQPKRHKNPPLYSWTVILHCCICTIDMKNKDGLWWRHASIAPTRDCRSIWPELDALISTSLHPIKSGHHILEVNMEVKLSLLLMIWFLWNMCLESTADNSCYIQNIQLKQEYT